MCLKNDIMCWWECEEFMECLFFFLEVYFKFIKLLVGVLELEVLNFLLYEL